MATIKNDRDIALQAGSTRILSPDIKILATNTSFNTVGTTTSPTIGITLTVSLPTARPSAVKTWSYALPSAPDTWITLGTGDTFVVTPEAFISAVGTAAFVEYKCSVVEPLYDNIFATYKISYSSVGEDSVLIDLLSESDVFAAANDGTGYGSIPANTIRLYKGGALLSSAVTYGCGATAGTQTATVNGLTATVVVGSGAVTFSGTWTGDSALFTFNAVYGGVTYTTVYTLAKSRVGTDAVFIDLLSESDVFAAANDGTGYGSIPANTIRLYKGGALLSSAVTYGCGATAGTQTATVNGLTATVVVGSGAVTFSGTWTGDSALFTFNAVYGGVTYTTVYTLAKSKTGSASTAYWLVNNPTIVTRLKTGTTSANTIIFTANRNVNTVTSVFTGGYVNVYKNTNILLTENTHYTYASGVVTISSIASDAISYTCKLYSDVAKTILIDDDSVSIYSESIDGIIVDNDNQNHIFTASVSGTISSYANSGTTMTVQQGNTTLTHVIPTNYSLVGQVLIATAPTLASSQYYISKVTFSTGINPIVGTTWITKLSGTTSAVISAFTSAELFSQDRTSIIYEITIKKMDGTITIINSTQNLLKNKQGAGYTLSILGGTRALVYDKDGLNPSPAQTAFSATLYENGVSVTPASYAWSATGVLSGTSTTATFTPGTPATYSATATSVTLTVTYAGGASVTQTVPIAISKTGVSGIPGTNGSRSITVSCFRWLASPPVGGSWSGAATLTWPSTVSASATDWSPAATANTTAGMTLYQLNAVVTDSTGIATSTAFNWSTATLSSIGYTAAGIIGIRGDSARMAYTKSTIAAPTGSTTSAGTSSLPPNGSFGLTGAVFSTSPPALTAAGEFLYQTDGIYTPTGSSPSDTITWQTPYLSNLKVGSLSAISANMGVVNIASGGNINSGKTSSTDTAAGFFIGNEGGTAKFSIGDASNSLTWNGTSLAIGGTFSGNVTGNINGTAAGTVVSNASTALSTANTANANAGTATTTANTANASASTALSTANTANANAGTATTTANTANANASTALSTANTANANASSALSGLTSKLNKAGDTITGTVNFSVPQGILAGTATDGVYFGNGGIAGKKAGVTTFAIDTAGNATFGGSLSAATGTFAGALSAATGTFSGSLSAATGTFSGSLSAATGTFAGTLSASSITSGTFTGLTFQTSASGARVTINESLNNMLKVYNASGIVCEIGGASGVVWATSNSSLSSTISGVATGALHGISGAGAGGAGGYFRSTSGRGVDTSGVIGVYSNGSTYAIQAAGKIYQDNGGTAGQWNNYTNSVLPVANNAFYSGYTGNVWAGIYSQTAVVVTSDVRKKQDIENCDLGLDFINTLRPVTYRMIEGRQEATFAPGQDANSRDINGILIPPTITSKPGSRRHYGLLAQEVKAAIGDLDCGFWTIEDINDADSAQGLRYEELIAPMLKAIQELSARLKILENKVE